MKSAIPYQSFFSETGLENSHEIGRFFREFDPENPAKFSFFFRDLPEALNIAEQKPSINQLMNIQRERKLVLTFYQLRET